ncbi:MAG: endolytic transglycosylase MltG [Cyanobacteria bacterium P01_F01_bin.150]
MGRVRIGRYFFYLLFLPLTLGTFGWQGWLWWSWASSSVIEQDELLADAAKVSVVDIPDGTSAQQIGTLLVDSKVIRSAHAWNLWTKWQTVQNREGGFLAGTYALSPSLPLNTIANQIWAGDVLKTSFTIPEGWAVTQMGQYFEELGWFSAADFMAATRNVTREQYPWLPEKTITSKGANVEGFLFPSTYHIADNPTPEMIVEQMLRQFEQTALPIYQENEAQSPYSLLEWVTLASIVEREAVIQEERPTIAAVFARRLREGIPLATDPTVEYAFGIKQTPDRPLTYAEVGTPHPYNTYINVGLPPGAIAAPGLASLEASLNPGETEFLYFMARFDGTHIFSSTLSQHESAKNSVGAKIKAGEKPWEEDS